MDRLQITFAEANVGEARALASLLSVGGDTAEVAEEGSQAHLALETAAVIVLLGSATLAAVGRVADWLRDRDDCLLVIDSRGDDLKIEERCDIEGRRGQTIIICSPGEQVVVQQAGPLVDLEALVEAATSGLASAVLEAAAATGASAAVEALSID